MLRNHLVGLRGGGETENSQFLMALAAKKVIKWSRVGGLKSGLF